MKILFCLSLLIFTYNSFGQLKQYDFPTKIDNYKSDLHVRIGGTKVYAIFPKEYQYYPGFARIQKNDSLYLQFEEQTPSSFKQDIKYIISNTIDTMRVKNALIKNIKVKNFDAIYSESPSTSSGMTQLNLFFGDDSFVVIINGFYKSSDEKGKTELQNILKSIFYDNLLYINALELANFEFDPSITNFKPAMSATNIFMFSLNGNLDARNPFADSFYIYVCPKLTDMEADSLAVMLLSGYEASGALFDSKNITKKKINDYPAHTLETRFNLKNRNGIFYQAILIGENSSVTFLGCAYDNMDDYLLKFKKTVESIKIK
jgi:hypothetical protein